MKKFLFAILVSAFTFGTVAIPATEVKAQSSTVSGANTYKLVSKTLAGVIDTTTITAMGDYLKTIEYSFTKSGGTPSGKVYLEVNNNGVWKKADSITLTDIPEPQSITKVYTNGTDYINWRFRNSAVLTGAVKIAYSRRPEEVD